MGYQLDLGFVQSVYPTRQPQRMDLWPSAGFASIDVSHSVSGGKADRTFVGSRGLGVSADRITTVVSHPTVQMCGAGLIWSPSSLDTRSSDAFLSPGCDATAFTSKTFIFPSYSRISFCSCVTYLRSTGGVTLSSNFHYSRNNKRQPNSSLTSSVSQSRGVPSDSFVPASRFPCVFTATRTVPAPWICRRCGMPRGTSPPSGYILPSPPHASPAVMMWDRVTEITGSALD